MSLNIALINSNRIKPPIGPLGLEYISEVLSSVGHNIQILDMCWEDDEDKAINSFFSDTAFNLVGITLRNTDDCFYPSCQSYLPDFCNLVNKVRKHTDAVIVLGGIGFSVMPELIMSLCQADCGIWQEGEFAFLELAHRIERGEVWSDLPNLIWKSGDAWRRNPPKEISLNTLPPFSRKWIDNRRYYREGGQAGVETKRGCMHSCVYCVEPGAKGKFVRTRPPKSVADEIQMLLEQGIDHIYFCDSEFNVPAWHARDLCEELIGRGLGNKLRWYAYCLPTSFSQELAMLMQHAGCAGINFGVDNGDREMLKRLRRGFLPDDIFNATHQCKKSGIHVLLDLLLGTPGETNESIVRTIDFMKKCEPDQVGITLGVRVYPNTVLANSLAHKKSNEGIIGGEDISSPMFFIEPTVKSSAFDLINQLIENDDRFLFLEYNTNRLLADAIQKGYRGAFWDILYRYSLSESLIAKNLRKYRLYREGKNE